MLNEIMAGPPFSGTRIEAAVKSTVISAVGIFDHDIIIVMHVYLLTVVYPIIVLYVCVCVTRETRGSEDVGTAVSSLETALRAGAGGQCRRDDTVTVVALHTAASVQITAGGYSVSDTMIT